ncbi:MAG: class I SAM-dependent methyltransferase [Gammaproteobacteria bacterium]|nr:class I SAM-dependent methyltransferase [Gammaproteobacteria bacterium]MDH4253129.1 class I SAM-dependent methyltransferase [Gammaproteobacteria bacterium]MDH5308956.1 class I SAM-dependent methyltransferase [Gammaproteobacteria bacterium]
MTGAAFKDHFSGHAADYAQARPSYPDALFEFLADNCARRSVAWDCATGNGQAAIALARHFGKVIATDASAQQIASATRHPAIDYRVAPAEASRLGPASIDLVTVAQALHWFDFSRFFAEVERVLAPGGLFAAWCYGLGRVTPDCDRIVDDLYHGLDDYWFPERVHVENGYRDIPMPFVSLDTPGFDMRLDWTAEQMIAYLRTWSAAKNYQREHGRDPIDAGVAALSEAWGSGARLVVWPLALRAGYLAPAD